MLETKGPRRRRPLSSVNRPRVRSKGVSGRTDFDHGSASEIYAYRLAVHGTSPRVRRRRHAVRLEGLGIGALLGRASVASYGVGEGCAFVGHAEAVARWVVGVQALPGGVFTHAEVAAGQTARGVVLEVLDAAGGQAVPDAGQALALSCGVSGSVVLAGEATRVGAVEPQSQADRALGSVDGDEGRLRLRRQGSRVSRWTYCARSPPSLRGQRGDGAPVRQGGH